MMASRPVLAAGLIGAAAVGAAAAVSLTGAQATPAPPAPRLSTATLSRTTLTESALTEGTLGYRISPPVLDAITGTYTWLPTPGRTIRPGQVLYRVDDQPVVLMRGSVPAWRSFQLGMIAGPDIRQLSAALIAEHFAAGLLTAPTPEFSWATTLAVERWQAAHGLAQTGQIPLGQVVFLPGAVRVGAWQVAIGDGAQPGGQPYLVTTDRRVVTVPVVPDMPLVDVGQPVSIIMPSQGTLSGRVTSIGPPPPSASPGGTGNGTSGGSAAAQGATSFLFIAPADPAATGTGDNVAVQISLAISVAHHVLAAPVSALLALSGGGYGVEVVQPSGAHRLVGVRTGIFASGLVQVSGAGLAPGTKVVVSQ